MEQCGLRFWQTCCTRQVSAPVTLSDTQALPVAHSNKHCFLFLLGLGLAGGPPDSSGIDKTGLLATGRAQVSICLLSCNQWLPGDMLLSWWRAEALGGRGHHTSPCRVSAFTGNISHPLTPLARASHMPNPESAGVGMNILLIGLADLYKIKCPVFLPGACPFL